MRAARIAKRAESPTAAAALDCAVDCVRPRRRMGPAAAAGQALEAGRSPSATTRTRPSDRWRPSRRDRDARPRRTNQRNRRPGRGRGRLPRSPPRAGRRVGHAAIRACGQSMSNASSASSGIGVGVQGAADGSRRTRKRAAVGRDRRSRRLDEVVESSMLAQLARAAARRHGEISAHVAPHGQDLRHRRTAFAGLGRRAAAVGAVERPPSRRGSTRLRRFRVIA